MGNNLSEQQQQSQQINDNNFGYNRINSLQVTNRNLINGPSSTNFNSNNINNGQKCEKKKNLYSP